MDSAIEEEPKRHNVPTKKTTHGNFLAVNDAEQLGLAVVNVAAEIGHASRVLPVRPARKQSQQFDQYMSFEIQRQKNN